MPRRVIVALTIVSLLVAGCDQVITGNPVEVVTPETAPSADPGTLPADGPANVGGVALPAGERIYQRDDGGNPVSAARAWLTEIPTAQANATWVALAKAYRSTGLWPVLTEGLDGEIDRPWRVGEFEETGWSDDGDVDQWFRQQDALYEGEQDPHWGPRYAGLATGSSGPAAGAPETVPADPAYRRRSPTFETSSIGLLLVPVDRPAGVLAAVGWLGVTNYALSGAELSAVLRSWEDRFGATVLAVGFDTVELYVTRPPTASAECRAVAKEHALFAPDVLAVRPFDEYAVDLCAADTWSFWWD